MALLAQVGSLHWTASSSQDVVSYRLYQEIAPNTINYDSPSVNVGNVTTVQLPVSGLPFVEGTLTYAVGAVDGVGNISDLVVVTPVLIDVTPPEPPTNVTYQVDF